MNFTKKISPLWTFKLFSISQLFKTRSDPDFTYITRDATEFTVNIGPGTYISLPVVNQAILSAPPVPNDDDQVYEQLQLNSFDFAEIQLNSFDYAEIVK
jgi:hypothetical protein